MIQINNKILEEMKELYIEGYGTKKIAKKFNLAITTTRNYLIKNKIKFREASKDKVTISQHNKFINLYHQGKPINEIAQICNFSFSTVQRHLIKSNINLKKRGNPALIKNQNYKELTLEKAYGIKPNVKILKPRNFGINNTFRVRLGSKQICEDILSYDADFREKTWTIPSVIKNSSKEIKAKYLQGFADSQGSVSVDKKQVILCNQNLDGLKDMGNLFSDIGIDCLSYNKNGILLCNRKNIEIFNKLINFNISYKKERLKRIVDNYKIWKTSEKEMLKLKPKIIELRKNGLSYPKISESLGISTKTAWNYAKDVIMEN